MNPIQFLQLIPALLASGKEGDAAKDLYELAPALAPVLEKSETWGQFIDSLPALHKSGQFKLIMDDIHDLGMIADIELGDAAHMAEVVAVLKAMVPGK